MHAAVRPRFAYRGDTMQWMRALIVTLLLFVLGAPFFAAAQATRPPLSSTKCPTGASSETSGTQSKLLERTTSQADAEKFLNTAIYCPNACYNLAAKLTLTFSGVQVDVTATHICTKRDKAPNDASQNPKRGCKPGEQQPSITLTTKDVYSRVVGFAIKDQTITKSRCDENALQNAVGKFFDGLKAVESNPAQAQAQMQAALDGLKTNTDATTATPIPTIQQPSDTGTPITSATPEPPKPQTSEDLSRQLQERLRVSTEQANELSRTNPEQVAEMLKKASENDTAGAQAIARQLNLNEDVMRNIASLSPTAQQPADNPASVMPTERPGTSPTTFPNTPAANEGLPVQCGTDGLAGNIMYAESRCARINSNPLSSVQGPYHFLCDTWRAYANQTGNGQYSDCAYRNDVTVSTQVMNARMDQFAARYGADCTAAGLSLTSCQYAIHVFGEGGYRQIFNAYQNNPAATAMSLCGSAVSNAACTNNISIFRNGGTVGGVFGELDRRLGGTGTIIPTVSPPASPFGGFTNPSAGGYTPTGSPFGGANPFGYSSYNPGSGYLPTNFTGTNTQSGTNNSMFSFFTGLFSGATSGMNTNQNTNTQAPVQQAVVSIIAQPQTVYRNSSIVVSWSTIGTRQGSCRTVMHEAASTRDLGNSHEGSSVVVASSTGQVSFAVTCLTGAGVSIQQVATVTVQ